MAHDEHAASAQDQREVTEELDADEPRTPMWLPLLGGSVFLVGVLALVALAPPGKTRAELEQAASDAAAAAQAAALAANPPPALVEPPARMPAPPSGAAPRGG